MDIKDYMNTLGRQARAASRVVAQASTAVKNDALMRIAALLRERAPQLLEANAADVAAARDNGRSAG